MTRQCIGIGEMRPTHRESGSIHIIEMSFGSFGKLIDGSNKIVVFFAHGYGMEISSDKSKIVVNSIKPRPPTSIQMNGQTLEAVN